MGPKSLPTIWYTYMNLVTKFQISAINRLKIHVRVCIFNTTAISLPNETEHMLRVVVQLVNIFTVLHMIGRSKKNERHMIKEY
jgi:hypothetical protein